tara:strand:+ start:1315 stop:2334 length:1020 start_codon:yes stop_codon:yes gene_type:complete
MKSHEFDQAAEASYRAAMVETYEFARCQRPDGSYYGTGGQCRQGTQVGAKEKAALKKAAEGGNKKAAAALAVVEGKMTKAEAKKELGYTPKEKPQEKKRNILQRAKDKLTGKGKKGNLDEVGFSSKDQIKSMFEKRKAQLDRIDDPARKAAALKRTNDQEKAALKAHDSNKKFASDLKKELPSGVKTSINEDNGAIVMTSKVGKDTISAEFSPKTGWNYQVNGGYQAGTVTDRAQQVKVASQVRRMYDATVRAAPEGQVFNTSAYSQDGRGAAREKAYQRLGFSKPNSKDTMYAVKRNGKMVPSNEGAENDSPLLFAEDNTDDIWMEIVFPKSQETKDK